MAIDYTYLSKLSPVRLRNLKAKLLNDLRLLEINQAQNRNKVRKALHEKDVVNIQILSNMIKNNRRKPNGLRELNKAIVDIEFLL